MRKALFIYNPHAGHGQISHHLPAILSMFTKEGYVPTVYATQARGDAAKAAAIMGKDHDYVICSGGDGTLNEVVSGLMQIENRPPMAFIPAGSTCDTATGLRIPKAIKKACKVVIDRNVIPIDIGSFNDKYFVYVSSFGSISDVSCFTPQREKKLLGRSAYIIEAAKVIPNMKHYDLHIEYDGGSVDGTFYLGMVTNSKSVGGFAGITGGNVNLSDGIFEAIFLRKIRNIIDFNRQINSVLLFRGADRNSRIKLNPEYIEEDQKISGHDGKNHVFTEDDVVIRIKSSRFHITSVGAESVHWVIDGEDAGLCDDVLILNNNKAIQIAAGRK